MGDAFLKRKICVITGTRADYGIFYPVMKKIKENKSLRLYIVATCMHLMREFGYTLREIEKDGFSIYEKVDISYKEDTGEAMAHSVGMGVIKFAQVFGRLNPDIVILLGDRGEMLSAAVSANYLNIPVAHIHGGEISGHLDGILRHAITKLAHIHFPATHKSARRILKMGEEKSRIHVVGAPALDRILSGDYTHESELLRKYKLEKNEKLILVVQHPVLTQIDFSGRQMEITMEAVIKFELPTIIIYPNADAGGRKMISVIKRYEKFSFIKTYKSIPHKDYLGMLRIASVLVGNSSSGIIEAPSFKLPVVNIGIRQQGRERSTNVIDVPHDREKIEKAIGKALFDKKFREKVRRCKNPYGDGKASERIVDVLSKIKIDRELLQKKLTL